MIKARNLARDYRNDPRRTMANLQEALAAHRAGASGGVSPDEFSLRDLAEQMIVDSHGDPVGWSWVSEYCDPQRQISLSEATSAVDSTAFANITGQLVFSMVRQGYEQEEFVASRLVPNRPTRLSGEKIPGITRISDPGKDGSGTDGLIVKEGQEYPRYGFGEEYVETPVTTKRGLIVPVTKEAIFFDRTNLVTQRASEVGMVLGLSKEKRLLDVLIGVTNNYNYNGTSKNTFYSATDSNDWVNHLDGNELSDWSDIDNAEQLFAEMTDPATGEPIIMGGRVLLVPPYKAATARRIVTAVEVRETTGSSSQAVGPNPLAGMGIRVEASRQLYARLQATDGLAQDAATSKGYWFYGDPAKAFAYMQNWPIAVVQAPTNSDAEFLQDIVMQFKASERGAAAVMEPRAWTRCRTLATSSSGS
jgi:hypothetical protein